MLPACRCPGLHHVHDRRYTWALPISVTSGSDIKDLHIQAYLDPMQQNNSIRFNTCESVLVITLSVPSADSQDGRGFVLQSGNFLTT